MPDDPYHLYCGNDKNREKFDMPPQQKQSFMQLQHGLWTRARSKIQFNLVSNLSLIKPLGLAISSLLLASLPAQSMLVIDTFSDVNAWQDALINNGQDFSLEHRSLAGLDCSPYTNGSNYTTLGNFCGTGISSQLNLNKVLSDPDATLTETNLTTHGIDGSGYSVSYGNTGKKNLAVRWTFPENVQGLFLDFTSSAFTKNTQIAITATDGTTQVVAVPNQTKQWGFITNTAIDMIDFIATQNGDENFSVASLNLATTGITPPTTEVPSPLLIPGFLGLGFMIIRRKSYNHRNIPVSSGKLPELVGCEKTLE